MQQAYDAIIVGARCAGSPTAMLLARKGYRVLVVDRATFPSDTVSTHVVQPLAVAALARWGLLDRLTATGCPPIHTYTFDFGPVTISGAPGTKDTPVAYCPRRTVLDKLLVDAAAEAGAEIREGFTVEEVLIEDGRVVGIKGHSKGAATVTERAQVVVGADGRHSLVAEAVRPEQYNEKPPLLAAYYTYWSGLPMDGRFETYIRPHRGFAAAPTHDGLTLTVGGWPYAEFEANKKDVEGNFLKMLELAPEFADRVRGAKREAPFAGAPVSEFLPQAIRSRVGAGGRRGLQQGPDHGARDQRRFSRRRGMCERTGPGLQRRPVVRRRDGRIPARSRRACAADVRIHVPARHAGAAAATKCSSCSARYRAIRRPWTALSQMNAGTISPAEFFSPESVGPIMASARLTT